MTVQQAYGVFEALNTLENSSILIRAKAAALKSFLETYLKAVEEGRSLLTNHYKDETKTPKEGEAPPIKKEYVKDYHKGLTNLFKTEIDIPLKPFTKKELKREKLSPSTITKLIPVIK